MYTYIEDENNEKTVEDLDITFARYAYRHIIYAYEKDPSSFLEYNITIKPYEDFTYEAATFYTDQLAYFYVYYVPLYNEYNGQTNDIVDFNNVEPDTGIGEPDFTTDISDTTAYETDIVDFNEISPEFENESGLENENSTLDYEDTVIDIDEIGTESENTQSEPADEPVVSETFEISDYEITPTEESNNNEPEIILETAGPEINTESDIIEDLSINTEETNNIHDDEVIEPLNSVEEDDLQDINYDTELEPVLDQSETLSLEFEDASGADLLAEDSPLEELVPEENLSEELPINDNTLDLAEPDSPIDLGFEQTNNPDLAYSAETGKSSISADYEKFSYTPEFEPDDIDTESIIKEIAALNHKRPDLNILNVYDLKFKEKLPVSQIASQLDMSENAVVESLNEIIAIV